MAMGKLSSLGVGSNVLSYDVIEKLKKADEKAMIEPIDKKMKDNIQKQAELSGIIGMLNAMRSEAQTLSDYSTYIGRKVSVIGDALRASVSPGVPIQDIDVNVKQIAKNDINEVGTKFESRESVFSKEDTQITFYARGHFYKIPIKAGATLGEVAQLVTDKSGGNAIGVVMKTGGANPYQLMINSKETGEESKIYFGSTLQSDEIASGSQEIREGELELVFKDANGLDQSVKVVMPPTEENSKSNHNAKALKEAIIKAIGENVELADLLGSDINVGIGLGGKSIILNDRRGYQVQVFGDKAKGIGFKTTETPLENLVEGSKAVEGGKLTGDVVINGIPINLSEFTESSNNGEQNAQAIVGAINNVAGVYAYVNEKGALVINSDSGEVYIKARDPKALAKIGLPEGTFANYSKTQEQTLKLRNIQSAQDAEITYNGVTITRGSNTINDIVGGVTLELVSTTKEGSPATVSITADHEGIIEHLKTLVDQYNELMPKLTELTRYDPDTQTAGIFNGVSFIRMIRSTINKIFSFTSGSGLEMQSLIKYGFSIDDNSKMSFDSSKLLNALSSNADAVREFFIGQDKVVLGKDTRVGGVFRILNDDLDSMVKGENSTLKLYEQTLTRDDRRLKEDRKRTMERLNARYDSMAERFAAYDSQIARTNNSFNSLQMMINQATKGK